MSGSYETIDVRQDGRRVFVTLDRPEVLNAQNEAFLRELLDVTRGLVGRDDFDAVAIGSSCDHWGSGLDLKAVAAGWRLTATTSEWWETALHHLETIRQAEIDRVRGRLGPLTPEQEIAVEALTRGIVNKIMHTPISTLKTAARESEATTVVDLVRRLFNLQEKDKKAASVGDAGAKN